MLEDHEIWKPVPGFEGRYEVSSFGRVRSLARTETLTITSKSGKPVTFARSKCEKLLALSLGSNGYLTVHLLGKTFTVHNLVLSAFIGPRPPGLCCCHADGNKQNNKLSNLRWGTQSENNRERYLHGYAPKRTPTGQFIKKGYPQ